MPSTIPHSVFSMTLAVSEPEVDLQGHLSNVAVVDLFNRATMAHSIAQGWDIPAYKAAGGMFVVRRHEIDYHAMAFLGDILTVETWAVSMEGKRAVRQHRILRAADNARIASGVNYWTYIDIKTGRPQMIPEALVSAFLGTLSDRRPNDEPA